MSTNEIKDVAVIGAGPAGMYAAFYCGLRKMSTYLFDSLEDMGGQLTSQYAEKSVHDLPGFPDIAAKDFIANLRLQMDREADFISIHTNTRIEGITKNNDVFEISTGNGSFYAKAIILTTGNGAYTPRPLGIENEDTFENIHYSISNLQAFTGRNVVVFGGGDSAVDWSLMLEPIAKQVSIVHRRDEFRAKESSVDTLQQSSVNVLTPFSPVDVKSNDGKVTQLIIQDTKTKENTKVDCDDIIVNFGVLSNPGFIKDWNELETTAKGKVPVSRLQETNIAGVFALGDVCVYDGRETQITTALGEVVNATAAVQRYVFPDMKSRPIR